jgi:hypothetical protein
MMEVVSDEYFISRTKTKRISIERREAAAATTLPLKRYRPVFALSLATSLVTSVLSPAVARTWKI